MNKEIREVFNFLQFGGAERDMQQGTKKGDNQVGAWCCLKWQERSVHHCKPKMNLKYRLGSLS
jgi:hypothetical protein